MNARARRKRAILTDRRREHRAVRRGWRPQIIRPLTGFDLYLLHRYMPDERELADRIFGAD